MNTKCARKYWVHLRFSATRAWNGRSELLGRMTLIPLFLGVLSALWKAVDSDRLQLASVGHPISGQEVVWYLAVTQWVLFSVPHPEFELEQQVRRGDVTYQLVRPQSLLGAIYAEGLGTMLVQAPLFGLSAFGSALVFAGGLPGRVSLLMQAIPFGLLGVLILYSFQVALGLSAFWLRNVAPIGWIWSKATFVLGGLMLPLPFYPAWLERFALTTPFSQSLYGPARILIGLSNDSVELISKQVGWLALGFAVGWVLARGAVDTISIDGG